MSLKLTETVENAKLLAVSLWRSGNYAEARELLEKALADGVDAAEKIALTINLSQVERAAGRPDVALQVLVEIAPEVERYFDPLLKGKFFVTLGAAWHVLQDTDKAFEAYTASSVWYERAKDYKRKSEVENNIALLMLETGRYEDAHAHLDIAAEKCCEEVVYAQIDESRARVLLAEGKTRQAFESALASVLALKDEDEQRLLLESLETLAAIADAFKKEREREEICLALLNSDGRIKQAARLLGLKHQTLAWKLEHQYPQLLDLRAPKKKPRGLHAAKA